MLRLRARYYVQPVPAEPRIYIYELPTSVLFPIQKGLNAGANMGDGIYLGDRLFEERLRTDWAVRTENPDEANIFYIPLMSYTYVGNVSPARNLVREVVDFVRFNYPFFNRTGGRQAPISILSESPPLTHNALMPKLFCR